MWRKSIIPCLASILPAIAVAQQARLSPTEILDKYVRARGGTDAFANITTFVEKGSMSGDVGVPIWRKGAPIARHRHAKFENYYQAPGRYVHVIRWDDSSIAEAYGCDGSFVWSFSPSSGLHRHSQGPKDCNQGPQLIPEMWPSGVKPRLAGMKTIGRRPAYRIKVVLHGQNHPTEYYLDAQTFMLVRAVSYGDEFLTGPNRFEQNFLDYRSVNGRLFSFVRTMTSDNWQSATQVSSIEINVPLDESVFRCPSTP